MFLWHLPSVTQPRLCCARLGQAQSPAEAQKQAGPVAWLAWSTAFGDSALPAVGGWRSPDGAEPEQAELVAPFSVPEPLLSLGVAHPMAQLHSKHDPFCTTSVLLPQPGLEELGGSLPWRVLGESCTRCPGKAFARRRESNRSV